MIVVKVGGSLFDHPQLGPGLRYWLTEQPDDVLLVPGGGAAADVVRDWDRTHGLGEESAHWLAVRSLDLTRELLLHLLHGLSVRVLGVESFLRHEYHGVPCSWSVTSDSIAAKVAAVASARTLILLKSLDIPVGTPWPVAAANGWVDAHFPTAVADAPFAIEAINFRSYLDTFSPPR